MNFRVLNGLGLFVFLIIQAFGPVGAYNFLVISPGFGFSHMKVLAKLADLLADAGHKVTVFQAHHNEAHKDKKTIKNKNVEIINYFHDAEGRQNIVSAAPFTDAWNSYKYESDYKYSKIPTNVLTPSFQHMCRKIFQDDELHKMLKSRNFDVAFSETFDFCGLYLADFLKIRSIISVFTGSQLLATREALGESSVLNYLPSPYSTYGKDAGILDRLQDMWFQYFAISGFSNHFDLQYDLVNRIRPGQVKHWKKIMGEVSYHFVNQNPFLDFVMPTISKVIPVGGFAIDYSNVPKVDQKFDKILNERPKTVFISFGSVISSTDMPDNYKEAMLKIFEANKDVTFLWKHEDPEETFFKNRVPKNVYMEKWFPQPSLLADKRVNLFITHGGLGSVMELAYIAKPAIVVPIFADQPKNARALERLKTAVFYSKHDIPKWEKLNNLIGKMLESEEYQKNANRLSEILNNPPVRPQDLVVKYAENAAKFGRIETLTPFITEMSFITKYNIDILGIFLVFGFIFAYLFVAIVMRCFCSKTLKNKTE